MIRIIMLWGLFGCPPYVGKLPYTCLLKIARGSLKDEFSGLRDL